MKDVVVGVDVGGTFTKFGIVDKDGNCLADSFIESDKHSDVKLFINDLHNAIEKLISNLGEDVSLKGIGIGAPNGNYYKGTIEQAPNLKWQGIVPFVDIFKEHYNLPIVLTNDANAAAMGEMMYGGAKGMKNFIVITLGTGLGSGIVVNGEVVYGNDGFAGELGHVNVKLKGRDCGCGRDGCLETYVSATGIKRTVFKLFSERVIESDLRNISYNDLTAKMIAEEALKGDQIAKEAFEYTGRILGNKLADTVAHTSPEAIFLFGGLVNAGDLILVPTRKYLEESLLPIYKGSVRVENSGLKDANVAVLGASALVWKELT